MNEYIHISVEGDVPKVKSESISMNIVRESNSHIVTSTWYTPELCEANPQHLFVFGDNLLRVGKGGQACIRDCDNSLGIATKREPSTHPLAYFYDSGKNTSANVEIMRRELLVIQAMYEGRLETYPEGKLVFPADGLGSGLSKMPEYCPLLQAELYLNINRLIGSIVYETNT